MWKIVGSGSLWEVIYLDRGIITHYLNSSGTITRTKLPNRFFTTKALAEKSLKELVAKSLTNYLNGAT